MKKNLLPLALLALAVSLGFYAKSSLAQVPTPSTFYYCGPGGICDAQGVTVSHNDAGTAIDTRGGAIALGTVSATQDAVASGTRGSIAWARATDGGADRMCFGGHMNDGGYQWCSISLVDGSSMVCGNGGTSSVCP